MELVMPGIGVLFWTCLIFLILFFILKKWAFPVINGMIKKREEKISTALNQAEATREEMERIQSENKTMMAQARSEREKILEEATQIRRRIEDESREKAKAEYDRLMVSARNDIEREKRMALEDIKNHVASVSLDVAEKVLGRELSDRDRQQALVEQELKNVNL
ncbi:MAG: F0F1 ATP synthase subunit B [Bacteroides sp.]|nr:F0F1 ATP synthase subunit B [Ruminococcus flavefaciens]MCM1554487.1 F0F1 ATP synthase subunit B [Bacteroides sp.]